jgi:hypothetical protein
MNDKLASRKLWVALGGVFAVVLTEWMGISAEASASIIDTITVIVPSYLAGQGIVDALGAFGKKK